ncbi:molybdate ABC transporter substrate-binding protein [Aestuariibius sp. HNIBRBA575]|uniref:molybdate ABC transporter substrate-binding protein n=1 Tax=Aestuariibius sp. HNIBRBA575 TaxID=3233343 RepID=UPI0034A4171C
MRSIVKYRAACLFAAAAFWTPSAGWADSVTVFAAASLKDALQDVAETYETETGHDVVLSLAGSSVLARQIQLGAPADVYISANSDWIDVLQDQELIQVETRVDLMSNALVLIASQTDQTADQTPDQIPDQIPATITQETDLAGMLGQGWLAMALTDAVPAGIYGKAALEHLGLWSSIADQVAQSDNVRAALTLVTLGEAQLGIVYATDAAASQQVAVVGHFDPQTHPQIVYPAAVLSESNSAIAADFLAYLTSEPARAVFDRYGFQRFGE